MRLAMPPVLYQRQELCAIDSTRPFRTPLHLHRGPEGERTWNRLVLNFGKHKRDLRRVPLMFQASTTPTRSTDTLTKSSAIMVDVETRYVICTTLSSAPQCGC